MFLGPSHPNFAIASASTRLAWLLPPWPSSFISTEHLLGAWSAMFRLLIRRGNEIYERSPARTSMASCTSLFDEGGMS